MGIDRRLGLEQIQAWLELINPNYAKLDPEQEHVAAQKREEFRRKTVQCYFDNVLPHVIKRLDEDPNHAALANERAHTLVSLMGFSPETTVISASVVRPSRLVVIYGASQGGEEAANVTFSYQIAHQFLTSQRILGVEQIVHYEIDPVDPVRIYSVIRNAIESVPKGDHLTPALVDITGGKKVMSATAGQVAWEMRLPLCYVEGEYDPTLRRPWPGTEQVIKLQSPSQQERLQMRIDALELYQNRNYPMAVKAFERCETHRSENQLDQLANALCRVYVDWTDLDLDRLELSVQDAIKRLRQPRIQRLFDDRRQSKKPFEKQLAAFCEIAQAKPLAIIAAFLELGDLYRSDSLQRFDFACMLVYRAMEAIIERGLREVAGEDFQLGHPDWELLGGESKLAEDYMKLSHKVDPKRPAKSLPAKIGFSDGIALLCIVANLHTTADMSKRALIKHMRGAASKRNESVLAHGIRTLTAKDYELMSSRADDLIGWVLGVIQVAEPHESAAARVQRIRDDLKPLELMNLHDPTAF